MAACVYCGRWAGVGSTQHDHCAKAAEGKTKEEVSQIFQREEPVPFALQFRHIVGGVFLGMWLFTITAAVVYAIYAAVIR